MPASTAVAPETVPAATPRELAERAWVKILEAARRIDVLVSGLHPRQPQLNQLHRLELETSLQCESLRQYADAFGNDVPEVRSQLEGAALELADIEALSIVVRRMAAHVHEDTIGQMCRQMGELSRQISSRVAHSRSEADHDTPALWLAGLQRTGYEEE